VLFHVAVFTGTTKAHHFYMARSYEYAAFDEINLSSPNQGKNAHIGFSLFLVGRFDGVNDAVCVLRSQLRRVHSHKDKLRELPSITQASQLDNCSTTIKAVGCDADAIKDAFNYMIADKSGHVSW
jgi:hypothetical protein